MLFKCQFFSTTERNKPFCSCTHQRLWNSSFQRCKNLWLSKPNIQVCWYLYTIRLMKWCVIMWKGSFRVMKYCLNLTVLVQSHSSHQPSTTAVVSHKPTIDSDTVTFLTANTQHHWLEDIVEITTKFRGERILDSVRWPQTQLQMNSNAFPYLADV